jgi:hypothetical protein
MVGGTARQGRNDRGSDQHGRAASTCGYARTNAALARAREAYGAEICGVRKPEDGNADKDTLMRIV